jgi:heme-degrading monooxygenase HmoA
LNQITTITFFRYKNFKDKLWAFGMMQFAHNYLKNVKGLEFYRLMGSGRGRGFNPYPDWSVYVLLQVWDTEEEAMAFFDDSALMQRYQKHAVDIWSIFMKSIFAKGEWGGANPFRAHSQLDPSNHHLAIITRATIRTRMLRKFWKYVPTSEQPLEGNKGMLFTKGIGEVPAIQMATFSIWKNEESLKQFAYQSKEHHEAIKKTRELGWYSEELFSRFQPYKSLGTWDGAIPVPELEDVK